MKKHFLRLFILLSLACPFTLKAQVFVIDNFDNAIKDSLYINNIESGSTMTQALSTTDKHGGTAALDFKATVANLHTWGSYAQLIRARKPGAPFFNFQGSDSLSLWIKVVKAPTHPESVVFRIHLGDRQDTTGNLEEYVYENATILDAASGWVNLKVPLKEIDSKERTVAPGDSGFVIIPSSWNPPPINDGKLDLTHISQYNISFITSGAIEDSIEVLYDDFERSGLKPIPFVAFNGKVVSGDMTMGAWGNSTSAVVDPEGGSVAGKAAIKWTLDPQTWDNGAHGWCGIYFDFSERNMGGNWKYVDTMKLRVKIPAEYNDDLRIQFDDAAKGNIKYVFKKADYNWDGTWKTLKMPLQGGAHDGSATTFDSTRVNKFEIIDETGSVKPCVIYVEDVWMGNPSFDVIAPEAPKDLQATTSTDYTNIIGWTDVPGEANETYNVYCSLKPITDVTSYGVELVKGKIPHGTGTVTHLLRTPLEDGSVSYYYAVTCTDASGNVSKIASTASATSNSAKGVPTIALGTPVDFKADGKITEFTNLFTTLGYKPISIKKTEGTGFVPANQKWDSDADISAKVYMAMDDNNLYIAFDVTDDYVDGMTAADTYKRDCPDLFIGLYDFRGAAHTAFGRGVTPDYQIRFNQTKIRFDNPTLDSLYAPGENYYWAEKTAGGGYIVEAKIPFTEIQTRRHTVSGADSLFKPVEGMKIPIDFALNDADATGEREGILTYSPNNEDKSYQDVTRWIYTWVGKKSVVGVENEKNTTVKSYSLSQNYPNPFNPSTTIRYSIPQAGRVTLKVFNVLGKEISTLVNEEKNQGSYEVKFDASQLASGIYFYQIESGSFRQVNKMLLLK
jgi:hypothetical protein